MVFTEVKELMEFELENKINLMVNAVLREVTYGGLVATGSHVSL